MKTIFKLIAVLFLLLIFCILLAAPFLNKAIKAGIEKFGPELTQTSVKVESVDLSIFSGTAEIKGFDLGNPEGFKSESSIKSDLIKVSIEPKSVLSNHVIVKEILIDAPEVTYEVSTKGTNISKILSNVKSVSNGSSSSSSENADTQKSSSDSAKTFQVDKIEIFNGKINIAANAFGQGGKISSVPLPNILLKDIGKNGKGVTAAELTKIIFNAIAESSAKAVGRNKSKGFFRNIFGGEKGSEEKKGLFNIFNKSKETDGIETPEQTEEKKGPFDLF